MKLTKKDFLSGVKFKFDGDNIDTYYYDGMCIKNQYDNYYCNVNRIWYDMIEVETWFFGQPIVMIILFKRCIQVGK